jgi:hypothetical protein
MGDTFVEKDTGAITEKTQSGYIPGNPYSKLKREITEEDLKHPAVQRILLSEIDKLEIENIELKKIRDKYYEVDKTKAVIEEKLQKVTSNEILFTFSLTIGSIIIGFAASDSNKLADYKWLFIVIGAILIIGGLISKFARWKSK